MALRNKTKLSAQSILMLILSSTLSLLLSRTSQATIGTQTETRQRAEQDTLSTERVIHFAGREWIVKSGCGIGPGPNCWSDSEQSVWVDDDGQLHLKIREIDGVWHSAEVKTKTCTRYGMHRFYVIDRLDSLDKNIVAALFLYRDDNHEVDIEFSKWGQDEPTCNAQYVVQPYDKPCNFECFPMTLYGTHSTHYIDWSAASIKFKSIHGHHQEPPTPSHLIHEWLYTCSDNPSESDCLRIHVNFWLLDGNAPSDSQEAELIVSDADLPHSIFLPILFKSASPAPWITITASGSEVWGEVGPSNYCSSGYKVALYALTDIWYVQPSEYSPGIAISPDCTWDSTTNDWDVLAAHLVLEDFSQPPTIGPPVPLCPPLDMATNPKVITTACFP